MRNHPPRLETEQLTDAGLEARNRAILLMLFDLLRKTHHTFLGTEERFGRDLDLLIIGLAIWLGDHEGRPMTPYKLAEYLGLPRTTVIRKVGQLQRRGIVQDGPDSTVLIVPDILATDKARDRKRYWIDRFRSAAEQLSKMDASDVSDRPIAAMRRQNGIRVPSK